MEYLIIIAVIVCCIIAATSKNKQSGAGSGSTTAVSQNTSFQIKVDKTSQVLENQTFNVFKVGIKGNLTVPFPNYPAVFVTLMFDTTDGTKKPVVSSVDAFRTADNVFFAHIPKPTPIPYQQTLINNWVDIVTIPIDVLVFPKKGNRKLEFTVKVMDCVNPTKTIAESSVSMNYENSKPGYEEIISNTAELEILTVKLAVNISGIDGDFEAREVDIIKDWIKKKTTKVDGSIDTARQSELNGIMQNTIDEVLSGNKPDLEKICQDVNRVADLAKKYETLDLLLKIAAADDTYNENEHQMIDTIANKLDVNMDKFRSISEKIVPVSIRENIDDIDKLLGIDPSMTVEKKREHLRKEYRKWNQRVVSQDPKIRKQAEEMLDIIAKERSKL